MAGGTVRVIRLTLLIVLIALGSVVGLGSPAPGQKAGPRAFVTNEFGGDSAVIDTATDRIIGRVRIGPAGTARPRGMAVSPDGKRVYVAVTDSSYGDNPAGRPWQVIAAIDAATLKITAKYRCGTDPERLDVTPDGTRLYCSNEDKAGVSIVDVAAGKIIATIPTGIEPEGVGISPNGRWVYVTAETSNTVTVIDTRSNKPVKNLVVGARPRIGVFSPDGMRVYVTSEAAGTLTVIDPTRQAISKIIRLGSDSKPVGVTVSPDSRWGYVVGGRCNCLFAIDAQTYKVTTVVQRMGRRPWGVAVTPDGKKIYTANGRSDDVTVIDATSLQVIHAISRVGRGPHTVVIVR